MFGCPPHLLYHNMVYLRSLPGNNVGDEKASTCASLKEVFEVAMDIKDEYATSGDETNQNKNTVRGRRASPSLDPPFIPSSSLVIGDAKV